MLPDFHIITFYIKTLINKVYIIIFLISTLFVSCSEINNDEASKKNPEGGDQYSQENYYPDFINGNTTDHKNKAYRINSYFEKRNSRRGFNGTVLFADEGRIIYQKSFGFSNFRKKDPLDINSSFQIASISKPFTATAILMLIERNKLNIEDKIQKFFPDFPYPDITIQNLLSHRSGLPNYMYFADEVWEEKYGDGAISNMEVIRLMTIHQPMKYYKPDRRYNYSNTNYCILAAIIEKVTGFPYEMFIKSQIFVPLEMNNSSIYNKFLNAKNNNKVIGYAGRRLADNTYLNGVVGDKGIYSSAIDLLKFDQALYTNSLISQERIEQSYIPVHRDLRIWDNYGQGWRINAKDPDNRIIFHTGWWKGFRSYFIRLIDQQKTLIVLSNSTRGSLINVKELLSLIN